MDLTTYVPTALSELKSRYSEAQYDATMLIKASLETVQEVTNSEAVLLDATNPAVMLLEMGACLSANCVQENIALLRKQYAALAETEAAAMSAMMMFFLPVASTALRKPASSQEFIEVRSITS